MAGKRAGATAAVAAACALLLLGLLCASAAPPREDAEQMQALAADDACLPGDEQCELSLRQLRGELRTASVAEHEVEREELHEHFEALREAAGKASWPEYDEVEYIPDEYETVDEPMGYYPEAREGPEEGYEVVDEPMGDYPEAREGPDEVYDVVDEYPEDAPEAREEYGPDGDEYQYEMEPEGYYPDEEGSGDEEYDPEAEMESGGEYEDMGGGDDRFDPDEDYSAPMGPFCCQNDKYFKGLGYTDEADKGASCHPQSKAEVNGYCDNAAACTGCNGTWVTGFCALNATGDDPCATELNENGTGYVYTGSTGRALQGSACGTEAACGGCNGTWCVYIKLPIY